MNHIQKAWLRVLSPLAYLINEKLAKRSGLFGRIGKFWMIGPREFGAHPINKIFTFMNRRYHYGVAFTAHRYSTIKGLTMNGFHNMRPFQHLNIVGYLTVLIGFIRVVYMSPLGRGELEPDSLSYLTKRAGGRIGLPLNSMNQRQSAHFIEINQIYQAEMVKRYCRAKARILEERNKLTDKEKKMKYAVPSYKYIAMKPVSLPRLPAPMT